MSITATEIKAIPGKYLQLAATQITGCITAKQLADIHFLYKKLFTGQKNVDVIVRKKAAAGSPCRFLIFFLFSS